MYIISSFQYLFLLIISNILKNHIFSYHKFNSYFFFKKYIYIYIYVDSLLQFFFHTYHTVKTSSFIFVSYDPIPRTFDHKTLLIEWWCVCKYGGWRRPSGFAYLYTGLANFTTTPGSELHKLFRMRKTGFLRPCAISKKSSASWHAWFQFISTRFPTYFYVISSFWKRFVSSR